METLATLAGLALWAFLAATIIPLSSEAALWAAIKSTAVPKGWLLTAATLGNVGGSAVNWWLGHKAAEYQHHRWFPLSTETLDAAATRFQRWGVWALLFSWVPVVGDPLTVAAGLLRTPFLPFLVLVAIGRIARYVVVAYLLA